MNPNLPGYLNGVLPDPQGPGADAIASADVLWQRVATFVALWKALDLIQLDPTEREKVGPPPSTDEQGLNAGYARLVQRFAPSLRKIGIDPALMPEIFKMDVALAQLGGADAQVMEVTRAGTLFLTADMTEMGEAAESAAAQIQADPGIDAGERFQVGAYWKPITDLRQGDLKSATQHRTVTDKTNAMRQAALDAAETEQRVLLGRKQIAATPLPAPSPLPGKQGAKRAVGVQAGTKTGTGATKALGKTGTTKPAAQGKLPAGKKSTTVH